MLNGHFYHERTTDKIWLFRPEYLADIFLKMSLSLPRKQLWNHFKDSIFAAAAKSLQSCPTPCDPIDGSPPGSAIPGILQARTLEWVAISFSNAWKWKVKVKSLSRVWLCDPMDCSPPGSSIRGIFQARVLEWGAIAFSDLYTTICKTDSLREASAQHKELS